MPKLVDDGQTVTLDVHGATVDDALRTVRRVVAIAEQRGRSSVRVIHGSSTSSRLYRNRSIKHALHEALDGGRFGVAVVSDWRADDVTVLSLALGAAQNTRPIRLRDVLD